MKLYEIVIKTVSGFRTPLKGDTLFGHFCWQVKYDQSLLNDGLDKWIGIYNVEPFAVFSSAWPKFCYKGEFYYALKRPDLPLSQLFPIEGSDKKSALEAIKKNKKKKWMLLKEDLSLSLTADRFKDDSEISFMAHEQTTEETKRYIKRDSLHEFIVEVDNQHNTICRLTGTTGEDMFSPFSETTIFYYPETELAIFVLINEKATDIDRVVKGIERIGMLGFGRDATIGCGKFVVGEADEKISPSCEAPNACYALSPVIAEKGAYLDIYFSPFIRFGKHGDMLAKTEHPFKNPVIMADEGAVFIPNKENFFIKPYIGRPASNISKSMPRTIEQGYAPYIPFKLEMIRYETNI